MQLVEGEDGCRRCWWGAEPEIYRRYHDEEWGLPVSDDQRLFEKLCLESFQSGLAWITILRKRSAFRAAFHNFNIDAVAALGPGDVDRLLQNSGIVRHRGKIESAINNAARTQTIQSKFGSLGAWVWSFEPARSSPTSTRTPESKSLSQALKGHGFTWIGPTTAYAFMQSMGLVNDHIPGCYVRDKVEEARSAFRRPSIAGCNRLHSGK